MCGREGKSRALDSERLIVVNMRFFFFSFFLFFFLGFLAVRIRCGVGVCFVCVRLRKILRWGPRYGAWL
jgi:hypothetical protein